MFFLHISKSFLEAETTLRSFCWVALLLSQRPSATVAPARFFWTEIWKKKGFRGRFSDVERERSVALQYWMQRLSVERRTRTRSSLQLGLGICWPLLFFSSEQTTEKRRRTRREEKRDMIGGGPGRELSSPPSDGISNLRFSNHSDHLLVSSWDTVRLFFCSLHSLSSSFFFLFSSEFWSRASTCLCSTTRYSPLLCLLILW